MKAEQKKISRFELLMDAGFGAQRAGDILIRAFAAIGRYVYIEPMIPSEISPPPRTRPALSGVVIRVADFDITNIGSDTDLILAAHEVVLDRRLSDEETNPNCKVLLDMGDQGKNQESYEKVLQRLKELHLQVIPFNIDEESQALIRSLSGAGINMFYLGMLTHIYNIPEDIVRREIEKTFKRKLKPEILEKNFQIFHNGYKYAQDNIPICFEIKGTPRTDERILIDGNSSLSMGLIDAGVKLYTGYPITPASSIMHTLSRVFPSYGGMVHQAEDEIAAIGAAIGAYFGGTPAATGTSGPGLSLKQEFLGFASAAEIPLIVIDAQRSGPSTGMPTKTEQSDLPAAIFGCHGDNTKIVVSVANVIDCFYAPHIARYLAEKLKIPVIIMTDFQTANSYKVISKPKLVKLGKNVDDIPDFVLDRFHLKRLPSVEDIKMVRLNQAIPGEPDKIRRVTGLNTDKYGSVNYFAGTNHRSHLIRNEKLHHVRRALRTPEMFGPDKGDLLVVGWGSTRGVIEESINECRQSDLAVSGMHLRVVYPLPLMLTEIFRNFKKVVTVEVAYGDELKFAPLCQLLRAETLVDIRSAISRATGRPVTPKDLKTKIRQLI